MNEKS